MNVFIIGILLLCFFLFSGGVFRHDVEEAKIFKLANEKQFDCVGRSLESGKTNGSGILVAPNFVLSAAHILRTYNQAIVKKKNLKDVDPADLQFEFAGKLYDVKRIILYPEITEKGLLSSTDLMLVELEKEVKDIIPALLNRSFDELNWEVTGVGFGSYGVVEANGVLKVSEKGKKNAGMNIVDQIGGRMIGDKSTLLSFDFDSPVNPSVSKMGDDRPIDLEYSPSGGDSGGGLFRKKNNKWELIGILHGIDADIENAKKNGHYGEVSYWTRVSAVIDWIEKEIK